MTIPSINEIQKQIENDQHLFDLIAHGSGNLPISIMAPSVKIENEDLINWHLVAPCLERIIRTCYKSEHAIKEGSDARLIKHVVHDLNHASTMEHAIVVSFRIVTSRAISMEAIRHRMTDLYGNTTQMQYPYPNLPLIGEDLKPSVSQESQRYVNYTNKGYQVMYSANLINYSTDELVLWYKTIYNSFQAYDQFIRKFGRKPEQARGVLPNDAKTEFVLTFNLSSLRNFFNLRLPHAAALDMRIIALEAFRLVSEKVGLVFSDFKEKCYEDLQGRSQERLQ